MPSQAKPDMVTSSATYNFVIQYFPEIFENRLEIPPHVTKLFSKTVALRDAYKNIWQVTPKYLYGRWYFQDGWAEFVAGNSVTRMDFLNFTSSSPGLFDVIVLGTNGNPKEGLGSRKIDISKDHQKIESDEREDVDILKKVSYGKKKRLERRNIVKAKSKKGKEVLKYQADTNEYGINDDFSQDLNYWDGVGAYESEENDEFDNRKSEKCEEAAKESRECRNDKNASGGRKSRQKKRKTDYLGKGILKSELGSRPKKTDSVKRMKILSESNKGKRILNEVNGDKEDSAYPSIGLTPRHNKKGKGHAINELRSKEDEEDREGETLELTPLHGLDNNASGSKKPHQKKRVADYLRKGILKSGLSIKPKSSYSMEKMKPLSKPDKGKEIQNDVSGYEEESECESIDLNRRHNKRGKRHVTNDPREGEGEEDYCVDEAVELTPQNDKNGKGREGKEPREDAGTFTTPNSIKRRKRVNVDYLGTKLFQDGMIPQPQCKYFVTTVKPKRMNELYIPKDILTDRSISLPENITLVDPIGGMYNSRLVTWKGGRKFYKGGWNTLCRGHHLTKHDYCICEFGDRAGYLFISFVRRNDYPSLTAGK